MILVDSRRIKSRGPDGKMSKEYARAWRAANNDKMKYYYWKWRSKNKDLANLRIRQYRQAVREWISAYKLRKGCIDCGYNKHHAALELDHVRGGKPVKWRRGRDSMRKVMAELSKIEIRCANCHKIRHHLGGTA